ncbi:hypothetical protein BD414DRAFT_423775 [Trametes punicea]|nr:hypothetical protein BD414DRAFT_423775 [Trametes punicea]
MQSTLDPTGDGDNLSTTERIGCASTVVDHAEEAYQVYDHSKLTKAMNKSGDLSDTIKTAVAGAQPFSSPVKSAYEGDSMEALRNGVHTLVDSLPGLLRALDEVAKLHPFIQIAVGAFRIVVELDLKRRDNDKKIACLFLQMRDMMEALVQLRSIKDQEATGPDGMTIEARMQRLIKQTADDITSCGNACDTYSKKRMIVKVINSSLWDSTLKSYIELFEKRRQDFTFALAIHIGTAVEDAHEMLGVLSSKVDILLDFFVNAVTPEQRELAAIVEKMGGAAVVMRQDETLRELLQFQSTTQLTVTHSEFTEPQQGLEHNSSEEDLVFLRRDLLESPGVAIQRNLEVFERKIRMQQRELAQEMRGMVHHEGDRVIEAVTSGPHDRIVDPDIHVVWREMRWPGHVKARHFVLALRDYYREQSEAKKRAPNGSFPTRVRDDEEWALEWVTVNRLQAIAEAFDDDASGFITVAEVNRFTASRPKDWSLLHWLAYWAIGWQTTTTHYRQQIVCLLAKMVSLGPRMHEANARTVQVYLRKIFKEIHTLTASFRGAFPYEALRLRFQSYVDDEENRLREGLETVHYDIDAMDTLKLVTGPGRIERFLFPLLYLLLKRDFEIIRLCQNVVIHRDELWKSADSLGWVFHAVDKRQKELSGRFGRGDHQRLDIEQHFKVFACKMFELWRDHKKFWSLENLRILTFPEYEYVEEEEDQHVDAKKLLNFPLMVQDAYTLVKDFITEDDLKAHAPIQPILGRWHGYIYKTRWPSLPMLSFCFHASPDGLTYEAKEIAAQGTSYSIVGGYTVNNSGSLEYNFSWTYVVRIPKVYFTGTLDQDGERLSGFWGLSEADKPYPFLFFKRIPPEALIARPPPADFEENRIRALWRYALTAVHNEVRRKLFSWSYLRERRDIRKQFYELGGRAGSNALRPGDQERLEALYNLASSEDMRIFFALKSGRELQARPFQNVIYCDICGQRIYDARLICLSCGKESTMDFCDKIACREATATRYDLAQPHVPSHDFVKVRRALDDYREIGKLLRTSVAGLQRARNIIGATASLNQDKGTLSTHEKDPQVGEKQADGAPPPNAGGTGHSSDAGISTPICLSCSLAVSYPCWYCIDCPATSNVFICQQCDERRGGISLGGHLGSHSLVCCKVKEASEDEAKKISAQRLRALEDKLGNLAEGTERRLSAVEGRLAGLAAQMERIERLLESSTGSRSA